MLYEGQTSPLHYHWSKMEDIINRGGNDIYITVYNGAEDGSKLDTDVEVSTDGVKRVVPAGTQIKLSPGESITITPYLYHDFVVPKEGGPVLLGEVSMCNDDEHDNRFYDEMGRFPKIEEDEKTLPVSPATSIRKHRGKLHGKENSSCRPSLRGYHAGISGGKEEAYRRTSDAREASADETCHGTYGRSGFQHRTGAEKDGRRRSPGGKSREMTRSARWCGI